MSQISRSVLKSFLFFVLFFVSPLDASVVLHDGVKKYDSFDLEYLYDEDIQLSVDEIAQKEFVEVLPSQFTKGYRYGNAWFKIELLNESINEEFILYFTESIWSELDLYQKIDSEWIVKKNGLNISLGDREIQDSSPAFSFHIKKGETLTLYLKGRTIASQLGEFKIFTQEEYFNPNRTTLAEWYVIYTSILLGFVLLNVYNFLMTRESIYGFYILYVLVYVVFVSMHSGIYINYGFPNWQEGLHALGQITLLVLLLFSSEFLELKTTYPLMKKVFFYLSVGAFIFAILLSQNIPYSTVASNVYFSLVLLVIVYVAIVVLKRGFSGAKYYLIALMFYLPTMTLMAMNFNAMLPNTDMTRYLFLGGGFLEIWLFTLILTNKYKVVSKLNKLLEIKTDELEAVSKQLERDSVTDFLTNLYNRRYFNTFLLKIVNAAKRENDFFSLLIMDIDYFKQYNDTYGHDMGDEVLQKVSKNLQDQLKRSGDTCFRLGGEEFGIIFKVDSKEKAQSFATYIKEKIESLEIEHKGSLVSPYVTVSLGLVCKYSIEIENAEQLYREADQLLYAAKNQGRNRVVSNQ